MSTTPRFSRVDEDTRQSLTVRHSRFAVAAFVCSALTIGPVGVVLGHVALFKIKRRAERGRELSLVALGLGYPQTVYWALVNYGVIPQVTDAAGVASIVFTLAVIALIGLQPWRRDE